MAIVGAVGLALTCACSHRPTRYRMLRFFFDGVPTPGAEASVGYAPDSRASRFVTGDKEAPTITLFGHTPYRMGRCGGCHNPQTGDLVRSLDQGLCMNCHGSLVRDMKYAHGPAAVQDCSVCHHHHAAPHKGLLLRAPNDTCFHCHNVDDLTTGPHHAGIDQQTCIACHDPHGGDDPFFLKRAEK